MRKWGPAAFCDRSSYDRLAAAQSRMEQRSIENNTAMNHWIDFLVLITVQGLMLIAVEYEERTLNSKDRNEHSLIEALSAGVLGGLALGPAVDKLIGRDLAFFQYYLHSTPFTILNGSLSYGLAIATALQFSPKPRLAKGGLFAWNVGALFAICVAFVLLFIFLPNLFTTAVAAGFVVLLTGEIIEICAFGTNGPVLEALSGDISRPVRNWIVAVLVGCVYEIVNFHNPVWRWWFADTSMAVWYEITVVAFGYVVLFHVGRIVGLSIIALLRWFRAKR